MRRVDPAAARRLVLFHLALAVCAALFPLYRGLVALLPDRMTGCILHDRLFLYCPLCGGTRALAALLRLHFAEALRANAFVVLLAVLFLVHDVLAWVRLLRGHTVLFRFVAWEWIAVAVLFLVFGVLRDLLLIRFGLDPLGDLGAVWNGSARIGPY